MQKLKHSFYIREDVLKITMDLLGKFLVTEFDGFRTSGMITEAEAYAGQGDRASHAFNHRRTNRTEIMYAKGGTAYVYLCYGIHHLFNVVTNQKDIPHAILIRGIEPVEGIGKMMERRRKKKFDFTLTAGPGAVSQALGIHTHHTGTDLLGKRIWIEDRGVIISSKKITAGKRVGVDYAGDDALLPYRFYITDNSWVSKKGN